MLDSQEPVRNLQPLRSNHLTLVGGLVAFLSILAIPLSVSYTRTQNLPQSLVPPTKPLAKPRSILQEWGPIILSNCQRSMPMFAPPCLKDSATNGVSILTAQELIFPAYKLRLPRFKTEADRHEFWYGNLANEQFDIVDGKHWATFGMRTGHNLVFENVLLTEEVLERFSSWKPESCLRADLVNDLMHHMEKTRIPSSPVIGTVVLVNDFKPSYQVFLNGVPQQVEQAKLALSRSFPADL